ncbi:MAG: helix-turn-helix domain-containing protein [Clostridia bacterium]|nr:helix-turn-helix domain-containing protein [Clostridia bacterium]
MKNIGKVLKIVRHANNMSLAAASSVSGVSAVYISELETEKKNNVSEEYLKKLAGGYGLQLCQIVELEDYYTSLDVEEKRKFRLTLMKVLEMIENNIDKQSEDNDPMLYCLLLLSILL